MMLLFQNGLLIAQAQPRAGVRLLGILLIIALVLGIILLFRRVFRG